MIRGYTSSCERKIYNWPFCTPQKKNFVCRPLFLWTFTTSHGVWMCFLVWKRLSWMPYLNQHLAVNVMRHFLVLLLSLFPFTFFCLFYCFLFCLSPLLRTLYFNFTDFFTIALVLVPTRELCMQVLEILQKILHRFHWIVPGYIMGGEKRSKEKARLRKGRHIMWKHLIWQCQNFFSSPVQNLFSFLQFT